MIRWPHWLMGQKELMGEEEKTKGWQRLVSGFEALPLVLPNKQ